MWLYFWFEGSGVPYLPFLLWGWWLQFPLLGLFDLIIILEINLVVFIFGFLGLRPQNYLKKVCFWSSLCLVIFPFVGCPQYPFLDLFDLRIIWKKLHFLFSSKQVCTYIYSTIIVRLINIHGKLSKIKWLGRYTSASLIWKIRNNSRFHQKLNSPSVLNTKFV